MKNRQEKMFLFLERFPWAGQNVGIDRSTNKYRAVNQSIYRITLKWFRQFELADAAAMSSFRVPTERRYSFFFSTRNDFSFV